MAGLRFRFAPPTPGHGGGDNNALTIHKKPAIRRAIKAVGARLLFLPPYSPDLNPIGQVFAKLKHLMRKAAERSHEHTWRRVGILLDTFTPDECRNHLRNSGYASA